MGFLEPWVIEDQEDQPQIHNSESEDEIPPQPLHVGLHQPLRIVYPVQEISIKQGSRVGRKRAKRQENNLHLITLGSDEYPDIPEDLIQSRGSPFAQLMKNDAAMQVWTLFMDASEEKQKKILDNCIHNTSKYLKKDKEKLISPEEALLNMSFDQRKFFVKSNLPLGLLAYLETEVIQFFLETPNKVYTLDKLSSYERRILHGVALYYSLQSKSYDCEKSCSRLLSLYNTNKKFLMPTEPLAEYLAHKRKHRSQGLSII